MGTDTSGPEISIIMNCLNSEKDLGAALASVSAQTFGDWEIIFWDNNSTDQSAAIAQSFGPKLRYFKGDETIPLGAARNRALAQARGRLISFLDCDDLWLPQKLEKQAALFSKNPKLGLACTDTAIFDGRKTLGTVFEKGHPEKGMVFDKLIARQWISMSSAMVSKAALDSVAQNGKWFDENLELCEEADVFYRIAHDWELDHVDEPLSLWRIHGANSTFARFETFADETLAILAKHRALYPDYDACHSEAAQILAKRAAFQKAVGLWKNGKGAAARGHMAPYLAEGGKYRLFWLASFLPGTLFTLLAKVYFSMPRKILPG